MLTPIATTKSGYISSATANKKKKTLLVSKKELIFRILKSIITSGHQGRISEEQVHSKQNSENSREYKGPDKEEIHHTHVLAMNIALMVCICFKISKDVHFSVCQ